jgi:hypothetical protein
MIGKCLARTTDRRDIYLPIESPLNIEEYHMPRRHWQGIDTGVILIVKICIQSLFGFSLP